jgi:hypothetical protein
MADGFQAIVDFLIKSGQLAHGPRIAGIMLIGDVEKDTSVSVSVIQMCDFWRLAM